MFAQPASSLSTSNPPDSSSSNVGEIKIVFFEARETEEQISNSSLPQISSLPKVRMEEDVK